MTLFKGPALTQNDLGTSLEVGGTGYTLCVYDDGGNVAAELHLDRAAGFCAGKPCWKAVGGAPPGGKGFRYADKNQSSDGLRTVRLKGGPAGKAGIVLKASNHANKGRQNLPVGIAAALAGSTSPVVQLHGDDLSSCFSLTYDDVRKDLGSLFLAKK